jgi:hypothetical protein
MTTNTPENKSQTRSESAGRIRMSPLKFSHGEAKSGAMQISVEPIPESFFRGLRDCDAGRTVDMDKAMNESPPGNA